MEVIYARDEFSEYVTGSIFLAGPSPRDQKVASWRITQALKILEEQNFDGTVFVPEFADGSWPVASPEEYERQVKWEEEALNRADCIVFWIPRDLETLPGFTTNIEWGRWQLSGKVILGFPLKTRKMGYLIHNAQDLNIPIFNTLDETLKAAIKFVGAGALRIGGECQVPLRIWQNPNFQRWYQAQVATGNRLDGAKQVFNWHWGNRHLFMWALHVDVWVAQENKNKSNEIVLSRPDIATVVLYRLDKSLVLDDTKIILVKDFRPPVCNEEGLVYDLPGGSSIQAKSQLEVAAEEVAEETGFSIDPSRLRLISSRQLLATLSCHQAHCFAAELTDEELGWFESKRDTAGGIGDFGPGKWERTYIEVMTLGKILQTDLVDWSVLGMIFAALTK